jgi:pyroglutamyl-peptidase
MKRTVLLTGFEPFAGDSINPTQEIAESLDGRTIGGARIVGRVLPCVYGRARAQLLGLLRTERPDLILCLGQAGGRSEITPERVAINLDDARIPDNAGAQPIDRPIERGGPAAYWSTLPIKAIVVALREAGIAAGVSQTAGTFVCNHVFYALMHALARRRPAAGRPVPRGGFIHVPFTPAQAQLRSGTPSLPLETMIEATELAIATALRVKRDRKVALGALD